MRKRLKRISFLFVQIWCIGTFFLNTIPAFADSKKPSAASEASVLDGKKVIFIGNSFTYYGHCVLGKSQSQLTQKERICDQGYFYQICKNNGADTEVTNWTWGGHTLKDIFGGVCKAGRGCDGIDHTAHLMDRNYDYVVIQSGSGNDVVNNGAMIEKIIALFRAVNPNVRFVYLCQSSTHVNRYTDMLALLKTLEQKGITVVDWGRVVYDLMRGAAKVEGSKYQYDQNTFIVSRSAADGYHPNMLTGYITALMTFSAITGKSAYGQQYAFACDKRVNPLFDADKYRKKYYTYGNKTTDFHQILCSQQDMRGIQRLIDQYLKQRDFRNY